MNASWSDPLSPTPNPALVSDAARVAFWEGQASRLDWAEPWTTAHRFEGPRRIGQDAEGRPTWSVPEIAWFEGGRLNVAHNCVDRHVEAGHGGRSGRQRRRRPSDDCD